MSVSIETVGVLLTLLYLAFELRANNKIAMSNSHREISKQLSEWYSLLKNPETSLILARGSLYARPYALQCRLSLLVDGHVAADSPCQNQSSAA